MKHMKTLQLLGASAAVTALFFLPPLARAQDEDACSCSPVEYRFELSFDGKCDAGSSSSSDATPPGGDEPVCLYALGGPEEEDGDAVDDGSISKDADAAMQALGRRTSESNGLDFSSHAEHAEKFAEQREEHRQRRRHEERRAQSNGFDTTPTVITSVSFLEFNHAVQEIINQDSSYFNTTLQNGQIIKFASISTALDPSVPLIDQIEFVPGGIMLLLFGVNGEGQVIQNTLAWSFEKNDCAAFVPASKGWMELEGYTPARAAFCPATPPTTTVAPVAEEDSDYATQNVTEDAAAAAAASSASKTGKPAAAASASSDSSGKAGKIFKAGKGDKSGKSDKAGKSIKAAKDASTVDAKAEKASKAAKEAEFPWSERPATKESSKAEKNASAKAEKVQSSKAEKVQSSKAEKGDANATSGGVFLFPKSSKAITAKASKSSEGEESSAEAQEGEGGSTKAGKGLPWMQTGGDGASAKAGKGNSEKDGTTDAKAEKESAKAFKSNKAAKAANTNATPGIAVPKSSKVMAKTSKSGKSEGSSSAEGQTSGEGAGGKAGKGKPWGEGGTATGKAGKGKAEEDATADAKAEKQSAKAFKANKAAKLTKSQKADAGSKGGKAATTPPAPGATLEPGLSPMPNTTTAEPTAPKLTPFPTVTFPTNQRPTRGPSQPATQPPTRPVEARTPTGDILMSRQREEGSRIAAYRSFGGATSGTTGRDVWGAVSIAMVLLEGLYWIM